MKRITACLVIFLVGIITTYAQEVKLIDLTDLQPIEDVFIYCGTEKSALSDENGKADLQGFSSTDIIIFQHRSYKSKGMTLRQIEKAGWVVKLEENLVKVNEVVVSMNRWEQDRTEIPNKIESITIKEIGFYNPQTSAELVALSDQVFVQKSQLGGGSPMIRGFSANRLLLVIDGVRMNNAIYRSGNLQNIISLDPNLMENSEIIFGPGSIIYGSDALGGVMDFHTRVVKLSTDKDPYVRFNAASRFSSANLEKSGHFDFSYGTKKWGLLSSVSFSDFSDQLMGGSGHEDYQNNHFVSSIEGVDSVNENPNPDKQLFTGYSQLNLMQKFRFRPSKNLNVTYAFHYSRSSDIPRYDRLIQYKDNLPKYAEWYYGPSIWAMHRLGAELSDSTIFYDKLRLTLAYQTITESRHDRRLFDEWISERYEYLDIGSFNIDADKHLKQNYELFYGLEWVSNKVFSQGISRNVNSDQLQPESSRYPDGGTDYMSTGLYGGFKKQLSERFNLITGIRANLVSLHSTFVDTTFFDFPFNRIDLTNTALNGSIGVVYHPVESMQMNLNLSTGFRAPNLDDVGKVFDSEPGIVIVPNEELQPEYAYNVDLGLIKNVNHKLRVEVTGFYTWLNDAMVRRDFQFNGMDSIIYEGEMSRVEALVNAESARIWGISGSFNWNLIAGFLIKSSLNYTFGEEEDGIPLRHAAPLFGATHLIYQANKIKADLFVRYNGEKPFEKMAPSEIDKTYMYASDENGNPYSPSWYTINLNLAYQLRQFLQINTGIGNILNVRYRTYSSGIVAPGRNFFISMRVCI